jgi:hypothetical protein
MSAGGKVELPLSENPWALRFAMFTDRYGKPWMVNCTKQLAEASTDIHRQGPMVAVRLLPPSLAEGCRRTRAAIRIQLVVSHILG